MGIIVTIPAIIAALIAFTKSPEKAFLKLYIPLLLIFPDYYRWMLPGLPDPTFSQAAILPIVIAFILQGGFSRWKASFADLLVGGFAFSVACSEYLNAGYNEAQNLAFDMLCWVICPYILAKGIVEPKGLRVDFAKQVVLSLFFISAISLFEFRFGMTPFRLIFDRFFPGQGLGWVTTFRYGFARVAGPYGHAILAGLIIVIGYRLQCWLYWSNHWEKSFKGFEWIPLSKATIIRIVLIGGSIMTMCRGPWIGAVLATGITLIGKTKHRWLTVSLIIALTLSIGAPGFLYMLSYASVGRAQAQSVAQETAAYRKELLDKYIDIALEHSVFGWGRNTWPKIASMPSIDNHYLLLALMHGLLALGLLVAIFLFMMARLFIHSMKVPYGEPSGSTLGFTLLGIYASIAFSIATVYMGEQSLPIFFLITGWAEGYLLSDKESETEAVKDKVSNQLFKFRRIIV
ncbi:MAG: O-antigen ligase family protein [Blastocatellia bacterium]|nr:O-antigen ligase family protein [Blastocatellia bacterium]